MKIRIFKKKIIIGTAQLLSNYGASNFVPLKNKKKEAIKLLNFCEKNNLNKFDTASGYKNERFIGNFFHNYSNKNFTPSFITKISFSIILFYFANIVKRNRVR